MPPHYHTVSCHQRYPSGRTENLSVPLDIAYHGCPYFKVTRAQRCALAKPLSMYAFDYPDRNEAMARTYLLGAYTI